MYGSTRWACCRGGSCVDQAGHGVTTDLMSHSVDLAHMLLGPITRVVGTTETFIRERPLPGAGGTHYGRGAPGDPTGAVTNEDYAGMLCEFAAGARGTFEASRTIVGPESQMAFEVYGTKGALGWNLEKLNELQLYLVEDELAHGLPDGVRRRPLPLPRPLRARAAPTDRLRGPRGDRGLRVLPVASPRAARTRAGVRRGAGVGQRPGGAAEVGRSRAPGSPSSPCGRRDARGDRGRIGVGADRLACTPSCWPGRCRAQR